MNKFVAICLVIFSIFLIASPSAAQDRTVLQILEANYTSFYRLVANDSSLVALLNASSQNTNVTVFAPTDAAISAYGNFPANATSILLYHIVSSPYPVSTLTDQLNIKTLCALDTLGSGNNNNNNASIIISNPPTGPLLINGVANITNADQLATSGIVQGITAVLLPPTKTVAQVLGATYSHTNALLPLSTFDLGNYTGLTFFAPSDAGWLYESPGIYEYLLLAGDKNSSINSQAQADLDTIIRYNSVDGLYYTHDFNFGYSSLNSLAGGQLNVFKPAIWPNQTIVVNDEANITQPNILASNGVVHGIDDALFPTTFRFTIEKFLYGVNATRFLHYANITGTYSTLLDDSAPRTLFVPLDNAWNGWNNITATQMLYHGVAAQLAGIDSFQDKLVDSLAALPSLNGDFQKLHLTTEKINASKNILDIGVNGRYIFVEGKTVGGNIVYLIDSVLTLPGPIPDVISGNNSFNTLSYAIDQAGLNYNLTYGRDITFFAPSDEAFGALPNGTVGYLFLNESDSSDALGRVLENHIVRSNEIYYSYAIPNGTSYLQSGTGEQLQIVKVGSMITVNGALVTEDDIMAANGVVHKIDEVLVPSDVTFNLVNILQGLTNEGHNFTILLDYLNKTNLISTIEKQGNITLFAPDNDAFDNVEDLSAIEGDVDKMRTVLLQHLVFEGISDLSNTSARYGTGAEGNNSIVIISDDEVELQNLEGESQGNARVFVTSRSSPAQNAYLYGVNRVMGVPQQSDDSGLKGWQIALIVIGGILIGLLILAVIGVLVYFMFFRHRTGYRRIDDQ